VRELTEMQKRILQQSAPKIDSRPRVRFRCVEWDNGNQKGTLIDEQKCPYEVTGTDLDKECVGVLDVGEYVSGIPDGEHVRGILIETGPRAISVFHEREGFDSVGPAPEVRGWDPHRGTPGIGHIRLGK
jgi:hypothetical protein